MCGPGIARRLILTGEIVDAREAARLGIAQWAWPTDEFRVAADRLVARSAGLSREALVRAKACLAIAAPLDPAGVRAEIDGIADLMRSRDTAARITAFLG